MVGWHEFEQTLGDSEGQERQICCSPRGCKEFNVATEQHQSQYCLPLMAHLLCAPYFLCDILCLSVVTGSEVNDSPQSWGSKASDSDPCCRGESGELSIYDTPSLRDTHECDLGVGDTPEAGLQAPS